ncbi:MAG: hypothetical protein KGJ90_06920, partial [Patescibacteria group bacterium]|nr:hypothetical protein [Patescibacteria group bacterium]
MFAWLGKIFDKLVISFNFSNRDSSSSNKAVVKNSPSASVQQFLGDIHITNNQHKQTRPRIDITNFWGSGGADGAVVFFKLKNDGDESAIDVQVKFTADDCRDIAKFDITPNLSVGQSSHSVNYRYENTDLYKRRLKNPRIVFRYKSVDGSSFVAGRKIVQDRRATGVYDIHKTQGAYFEGE